MHVSGAAQVVVVCNPVTELAPVPLVLRLPLVEIGVSPGLWQSVRLRRFCSLEDGYRLLILLWWRAELVMVLLAPLMLSGRQVIVCGKSLAQGAEEVVVPHVHPLGELTVLFGLPHLLSIPAVLNMPFVPV